MLFSGGGGRKVDLRDPLLPLGVGSVQMVAEGVIVTVVTPVMEREDVVLLQVFVTPVVVSVCNSFLVGEVMAMEEPEPRTTERLSAFTVIDSMTAEEPEMFRV